MAELTGICTSGALTRALLIKHNILIKDLSAKTGGNYIRLAVRDTRDNDVLLAAIQAELVP